MRKPELSEVRWPRSDEVPSSRELPSARALEALRRGDALATERRFAEAAATYVTALRLLPARALEARVEAFRLLGDANLALDRTHACMHAYQRALALDADDVQTLRSLAYLHFKHGECERALQIETRLLACIEEGARSRELMRSGDRWWTLGRNLERARARYAAARNHLGHDVGLAERLAGRLSALEQLDEASASQPCVPNRMSGNGVSEE